MLLNSNYFNYRQKVTKQGPSKQQKEEGKEIVEVIDQNAFSENENVPINRNESAEAQVDVQCQAAEKESIKKKSVVNSDVQGFEQVSPGVFQFKHTPQNTSPSVMPKLNYPAYPMQYTPQPENTDMAESGFLRVDGVPGPYEQYQTPVYQFT